jgi:hypothetical protein
MKRLPTSAHQDRYPLMPDSVRKAYEIAANTSWVSALTAASEKEEAMWAARLVASEKQSSDITKLCAAQTNELLCLRAKFADSVKMAETAAAVGEQEAAKARRQLVEMAEVTMRAVSRAERAELQVAKLRNQFKAGQILFANINVELERSLASNDPVETRDSADDKVLNHIAAARRSHSEGSEHFRPVEADLIAAATVLIKFAFGFRDCEAEAGAHRVSARSPPQHAESPARSDGADGPRDIVDH